MSDRRRSISKTQDTAALRRRMAKAIDLLIAAMDELDGDADLEAGGDDELTLGAPENHPPYVSSQGAWGHGRSPGFQSKPIVPSG